MWSASRASVPPRRNITRRLEKHGYRIVMECLDNLFGMFCFHDIARRNDSALVNPPMLTHWRFFELIFRSFSAGHFSKRYAPSAQRSRFLWPFGHHCHSRAGPETMGGTVFLAKGLAMGQAAGYLRGRLFFNQARWLYDFIPGLVFLVTVEL